MSDKTISMEWTPSSTRGRTVEVYIEDFESIMTDGEIEKILESYADDDFAESIWAEIDDLDGTVAKIREALNE